MNEDVAQTALYPDIQNNNGRLAAFETAVTLPRKLGLCAGRTPVSYVIEVRKFFFIERRLGITKLL